MRSISDRVLDDAGIVPNYRRVETAGWNGQSPQPPQAIRATTVHRPERHVRVRALHPQAARIRARRERAELVMTTTPSVACSRPVAARLTTPGWRKRSRDVPRGDACFRLTACARIASS